LPAGGGFGIGVVGGAQQSNSAPRRDGSRGSSTANFDQAYGVGRTTAEECAGSWQTAWSAARRVMAVARGSPERGLRA
jgi:hypothetical protein